MITKDVKPYVVFKRVSWTTLLYYLGEWLWDWTGEFVGMLLCMKDHVNSLVALSTKHFDSLSAKHRFPSQRSRLDSKKMRTPMNTVLIFSYCISDEYRRRFRSCVSVKILPSAFVEPNLGRRCRVEVWRRGGMNKPFGQKWFVINSEVQNNRKVFPGWILRQERKSFTV